jgi:hypothetical protein
VKQSKSHQGLLRKLKAVVEGHLMIEAAKECLKQLVDSI